tara:strand:- start:2137 stop:2892 length:756 start_codon:yes stop_codon:yes gene_type:complete
MSNVIQFSITGDTNAEQVAGRAKTAVAGLDKQMDGIGKRFGSGFKDIFLSFLGPMALLSTAMAFIGKMISDNQKKQEDANKAAIEGTNALMSAEDKYWANKRNNEKKAQETTEESKTQRETTTREFLDTDPRGREMVKKHLTYAGADPLSIVRALAKDKGTQEQVQALIAEDMKKNPAAGVNLKDTTFQGPAGFSNVIGVGANPVLENLTRQTDIQQQILDGLKAMSPRSGGINQPDFTKEMPLPIQKAGL